MPTRRFDVNKEQSLAEISAGNAGNGNDDHCPNGRSSFNSTITFRTLLRFAHDHSGMTQVTKVELFIRKTSGVHTAQGGSANMHVNRCGSSWDSGGGAENSWSTTASGEKWPGPGMGTSNNGSVTGTGWQSLDITDAYMPMVPSSVGGGGESNYGIRIRAENETSTSNSFEFYGMDSAYPPYLIVTYTTNTAPAKPTNTSPVAGAILAPGTTPLFSWTGSDPDSGDTRASSTLQVSTDPAFGTTNYSGAAGSGTGFSQTGVAYPGPTLPAGVPLYWRVRNTDQDGAASSYSNGTQFTIAAPPTISATTPAASTLADIHNLGDLTIWTTGGAHAKPIVKWTYQHSAGRGMEAYRVRMYSDALATLYDSGTVAKSATPGQVVTVNIPTAIVLGTQYRWGVEVQDVDGNWSTAMTPTPFKVRWGQGIYSQNVGTTATGFKWANSPTALGRVQFLYRSANDAAGSGATAWSTGLPAPGKAYVQVLVRLLAITAGENPALPDMTLTYTVGGSDPVPDKWLATTSLSIALDSTIRRFGAYSARVTNVNGINNHYIYPWRNTYTDGVDVVPDTDYVFSAYVRSDGPVPGGGQLTLSIYTAAGGAFSPAPFLPQPPGTARATTDTSPYPDGWQRLVIPFHVPAGVTAVRPVIRLDTATVGAQMWVDGVQLEEGVVVSKFNPGTLGEAATLDRFGLMVDASQGGILRLRGSTGATRATVELGSAGLIFGGDVEVSAMLAKSLAIADSEFMADRPKSTGGQFRAVSGAGGYGFMIRMDGTRVYFLLTNAGDPYGLWNALRPLYIDNATGQVVLGNGLGVTGAATFNPAPTVGGVPVALTNALPNIRTVRGTGAALGAGLNNSVAITWSPAFADANYSVVATPISASDAAIRMITIGITAKTAAGCTLRFQNHSSGTTITPGYEVIAIHD
jgi:hypothetical protein